MYIKDVCKNTCNSTIFNRQKLQTRPISIDDRMMGNEALQWNIALP